MGNFFISAAQNTEPLLDPKLKAQFAAVFPASVIKAIHWYPAIPPGLEEIEGKVLDRVKAAGFRMACLTNNIVGGDGVDVADNARSAQIADIMARFDVIVESSKIGVRKPEQRFYEVACDLLGVQPDECVFLDDLGVNLKPAAAMGMITIKVSSEDQAIADLSAALGWT